MKTIKYIRGFPATNAVLRDPAFSAFNLPGHFRRVNEHTNSDLSPLIRSATNNPFFLEGPRLRMLHLLLARMLAPTRMLLWRATVEVAVDRYLDLLPRRAQPDLIRDFVHPVFRTIMGAVIGCDASDTDSYDRWAA